MRTRPLAAYRAGLAERVFGDQGETGSFTTLGKRMTDTEKYSPVEGRMALPLAP